MRDRENRSEGFLPVCKKDMERLGIRQLDLVYVIGDAFVDQHTFGHAWMDIRWG